MLYLVALLLISFAIMIASGIGPALYALIDFPSLLLIIGLPLTLLAAAGLYKDFLRGFRVFVNKVNIYNKEELSNSLLAIRSFIKFLWLTAVFGTLLGFVMTLSQVKSLEDVLPSLSVSMLMAFYGSIIHLLLSVLPTRIQKLLNQMEYKNEL